MYNEAAFKYVVNVICKDGNMTYYENDLTAAMERIPKGAKYYEINNNSEWNFSELKSLVRWGGHSGYWANRLNNTAVKSSEKESIKAKEDKSFSKAVVEEGKTDMFDDKNAAHIDAWNRLVSWYDNCLHTMNTDECASLLRTAASMIDIAEFDKIK